MTDDRIIRWNVNNAPRSIADDPMTDNDRAILAFIRDNPGCAYYQLAERFKLSDEDLRHSVILLLARKLIVQKDRPTMWFSEQKYYVLASTFYPA